jgi:predicted amidohydrolase
MWESAGVLVACCQIAPRIGELDANRALAARAVEAAAARGARVVVLPELCSSGYVFRDAAEARALAEPDDGPTTSGWVELARRHDLVIVGGFCEVDGDGALRNSAALVDSGGVRAVYRKAHLWDRESEVFLAGDDPPPVVHTDAGRIAVMVCYDLEFPEWVRLPALAGAQLLAAPANWPAVPVAADQHPGEVVRVQADACVNRIFVAACDRHGPERGVEWIGGSVIADPDGARLAGPPPDRGEALLLADCDLARADDKRVSAHNDVLADRRPELYGPVATLPTRARTPSSPRPSRSSTIASA